MNKIYKIVWSKAKHAYVVTSEVARSHTKSASGKAVKAVLAAAVGMGVLMGGYAADAAPATNPAGNGPGIAIGTGSSAPKVENVAIGQGAGIGYSNGASAATGDVAIGNGANINNYASQGGSIAIGKNAKVENMAGGGEASFAFGQTTFSGSWLSLARIPADPTKVVGSVAIGDNTFARTGSTMIGSHNYKGALGDTTVDSASTRTDALNVYATTIGANSFSNGAFTTSTGAYNIISGDYNGGRSSNAVKNLGATITGSLNSIESKTGSYYSGIANTVSGVANRTFNSNGSLIYGAGNEITNSYTPLYDTPKDGGSSAKAFADKLRKSIRDSKSGGATLAIGGGNKADYTQKTSIIGVNNTVTGTSRRPSTYNSITGFKNAATNVNHVSVIGSENEVENTDDALVLGNKRKLAGANGSVILGSGDSVITTNVENAVSIGHNANVQKAGGVALGSGSVASVDKGVTGYDPSIQGPSAETSSTWQATEAAVSVGDTSKGITRQITGVAAGTEDTDAVNVAQLKKVEAKAEAAKTNVTAGENVTVEHDTATNTYKVSAKDTYTTGGTYDAATKKLKFTQNDPTKNYEVDVSGLVNGISGEVNKGINFAGDTGTSINRKMGETLQITGGATEVAAANNIGVVSENGKLNLKLAKNIDLGSDGSIKTGDTKMNNKGLTIQGGPSVIKDGIDAGSKKITHVAAGEVSATSTDAVNGSQLQSVKNDVQNNTQNIYDMGKRVGELGTRVNRVGAGAAALAALHPLDFDPDDKWDVAAGYGNYKDAHAVAVGAFYRPNEDTMFSVGGSFGGGENMVNAGVSVKLGQGNHVSTSRVALAREVEDLKAIVKAQSAEIKAMRGAMQSGASVMKDVDFPDVPKDHWAYSYVKSLADRGLLEGYPDGEFKGDRSMTRYEFAAIIYRALQNGAPIDSDMAKAIGEFDPEINRIKDLDRIRVDRISGKDNDRNKVERVRVNNESNKETGDYRDVYGSHVSPEA